MVVAGDAANGRLDGIAPQARVEVFVEQGLELGFGSGIVRLGVHAGHSEHGEKGEEEEGSLERHARTRLLRSGLSVERQRRIGLYRGAFDLRQIVDGTSWRVRAGAPTHEAPDSTIGPMTCSRPQRRV